MAAIILGAGAYGSFGYSCENVGIVGFLRRSKAHRNNGSPFARDPYCAMACQTDSKSPSKPLAAARLERRLGILGVLTVLPTTVSLQLGLIPIAWRQL
jgi:hypothetical protein